MAAERAVAALAGSSSAVEAATPYYPWRAAPRRPARPRRAGRRRAARARVLDALRGRPRLLPLAPLLNDLLGLALPDGPATRQTAGQTRADNLDDLLVALLDAAAGGRPAVVLLEDAQWADASSWRLVRCARERREGLLVVLSIGRHEAPLPAEYDLFAAAGWTDRVALGPLDEAETRELTRLRLGADRVSDGLAAVAWSRTQGNPLFVEQMADHLRAVGLVEVRGGTAGLRAAAGAAVEAEVPDSVRGLVTARIDRFRPPHQSDGEGVERHRPGVPVARPGRDPPGPVRGPGGARRRADAGAGAAAVAAGAGGGVRLPAPGGAAGVLRAAARGRNGSGSTGRPPSGSRPAAAAGRGRCG